MRNIELGIMLSKRRRQSAAREFDRQASATLHPLNAKPEEHDTVRLKRFLKS